MDKVLDNGKMKQACYMEMLTNYLYSDESDIIIVKIVFIIFC